VRTHKGVADECYGYVYQREDGTGRVGVSLACELMAVAEDALKTNITTLGPLVLPLLEQLKFLRSLMLRRVLRSSSVRTYIPDLPTTRNSRLPAAEAPARSTAMAEKAAVPWPASAREQAATLLPSRLSAEATP